MPWGRLALWSVLGLALAFALGYAIAVFLLFPAPAAAAPGIVVPGLVGKDTIYARRQLEGRGLRLGSVTQVPDGNAPLGMVVAQDALAGQQLRRNALVNVAVSIGAERAVLPNVVGYAATRAAALLGALGFQVTQQPVQDVTPAGRVVGLSPAPGVAYDLPTAVALSVSSGPPPDTAAPADSLAGDTAAAAAAPPGAVPAHPAVPGAPAPAPVRPSSPAAPAPGAARPAPAGTQPASPTARPLPAPQRPAARDTVRHGAPGVGAPAPGAPAARPGGHA